MPAGGCPPWEPLAGKRAGRNYAHKQLQPFGDSNRSDMESFADYWR